MNKILTTAFFAVTALAIGCSSASDTSPAATAADAGKADASRSDAAPPAPRPDAGGATDAAPSLGTDGSITTTGDAGACGFTSVGPAEGYTGTDDNGDPAWVFYGSSSDAALSIENYASFGGLTAPGTAQIRPDDESYETCGLCIILRTGCTPSGCAKTFMPVAGQGSINVTELGGVGQRFVGTLNGLQLREVTIDPASFATTPVAPDAGGTTQCLSGVAFEALLDDFANMP
jgi:hypothetical protein